MNADLLLISAKALKADDSVLLGIESIIAANADIQTRMDMSAALTHENVTSQNELTVLTLRSEALAFAVATVTGRTNALLMSEELKIEFQHSVLPPLNKFINSIRYTAHTLGTRLR
jgi:hypothetical protein